MRRVLATLGLILAASSTVSTVSAGEIKLGAWGRGMFVPIFSDGDSSTTTFNAVSWGTGACRIGATLTGTSDNMGFQIDFNGDNGKINPGDQQLIWAKPFDWMKITVGRAYDDVLRGNGDFGDFNWIRSSWTGEDVTFQRVTTYDGGYNYGSGYGSIIALDPVKELHAYVAFKSLQADTKAEHAYKNLQIGAGYNIAEKAHIRAQYIGLVDPAADTVNKSVINAALKLTLSESIYADLGAFIPLDKDAVGYSATIAAYLRYKAGAMALHGLGKFDMGKKDSENKDATGMEFGLGFDYAIGDNGLGLVSSFRYLNDVSSGDKDGRIAAMVGIEKGFSNGKVGIGFQFSTTQFAAAGGSEMTAKAKENASIAVPVKLEYWF
jgi:hypothetical protein